MCSIVSPDPRLILTGLVTVLRCLEVGFFDHAFEGKQSWKNHFPYNCHSCHPERKSLVMVFCIIEPWRLIIEFRHFCSSFSLPNRHSRNVLAKFAQY